MSDDAKYIGHLLEVIRDEVRAVHEGVAGIREVVNDQPTRAEFNELKRDVKTIKASVTDLSRDLEKHKSLPTPVAHGHA